MSKVGQGDETGNGPGAARPAVKRTAGVAFPLDAASTKNFLGAHPQEVHERLSLLVFAARAAAEGLVSEAFLDETGLLLLEEMDFLVSDRLLALARRLSTLGLALAEQWLVHYSAERAPAREKAREESSKRGRPKPDKEELRSLLLDAGMSAYEVAEFFDPTVWEAMREREGVLAAAKRKSQAASRRLREQRRALARETGRYSYAAVRAAEKERREARAVITGREDYGRKPDRREGAAPKPQKACYAQTAADRHQRRQADRLAEQRLPPSADRLAALAEDEAAAAMDVYAARFNEAPWANGEALDRFGAWVEAGGPSQVAAHDAIVSSDAARLSMFAKSRLTHDLQQGSWMADNESNGLELERRSPPVRSQNFKRR